MSGLLSKIMGMAKKRITLCSAVIVAAGESSRMGMNKMKMLLDGIPVLARTLTVFQECECISEIIVVTRTEDIVHTAQLCQEYGIDKATKILAGGNSRTVSALTGVSEISEKAELVAIHDGARPLVTPDIIQQAVEEASVYLAAAPGIPVKDTVKLTEDGMMVSTPNRKNIVAVQTPQVFEADLIKAALIDAVRREIELTDDCMAVEALGVRVRMTLGSEENIKITTPLDFKLAEAILDGRRGVL